MLSIAATIFGVLAKLFLGLFVKAKPALSPEAVQAAQAAQDHITAAISSKTAVTQAAVAQAEVDAPSSKASVIDTLDKGQF